MVTAARQACAHSSLISLEREHNRKVAELERKRRNEEKAKRKTGATALPANGTVTRESIRQLAYVRARNAAKARMRMALDRYQNGDEQLLECPVCFDAVGESEIALPACAHPMCTQCVLSLLGAADSTGDATGHCPTCRDVMKRSEITFLSEAQEAGASPDISAKDCPIDSKPTAVSFTQKTNGYQITLTDSHAESTGTTTLRAGYSAPSEDELRSLLRNDRHHLFTLDEKFLANYYHCQARVGTKVARLLYEIDAMLSKDAQSKCVAFSQYVGLLDVVAGELKARGIVFSRIDEHMKQHERADALMEFTSNPNAKVFLLSMRNGAGLNLTVADHCFLMDVAANSAIEEQSIDRIHRIGQTRPVTVKRFVIEDTVEERLLGVRRALAVDRPSEGTQVCGDSAFDDDERPSKRARRAEEQEAYDENAQRQQRVESLAILFGCSQMNIHKA